MQQSVVSSVRATVRPSTRGCAARQRIPRARNPLRVSARFAASTTGRLKMAPIELRTARRRNGLLEVGSTISACAPNATQLRTNAPTFSALVRNCVAFGAHALIVDPTSSSPFLRRAVRSSMGAIFNLPVVEAANLAETLSGLRARGIRCLAAHPRVEGRTVARTDLTTDCCIVFGSEGYGLAPAVLAACDEAVAVPMNGGVDSLNVGSASAVFLYEANRQRRKM